MLVSQSKVREPRRRASAPPARPVPGRPLMPAESGCASRAAALRLRRTSLTGWLAGWLAGWQASSQLARTLPEHPGKRPRTCPSANPNRCRIARDNCHYRAQLGGSGRDGRAVARRPETAGNAGLRGACSAVRRHRARRLVRAGRQGRRGDMAGTRRQHRSTGAGGGAGADTTIYKECEGLHGLSGGGRARTTARQINGT